jgi:PAS domain S-box-containing protein
MIAGSAIAAVISDPNLTDTPIVECNDAFLQLTGYARHEIIGRNCRFLSGPDTKRELTDELRAAVFERRPTLVEILNYKKDGTPFHNAVMVAPIFGEAGELRYFLGSQVEIVQTGSRPSRQPSMPVEALSPRQKEVLLLMAAGKLNKQIAFELGITERTVKMHRSDMLKALGCKTGADAIRIAIEAGY